MEKTRKLVIAIDGPAASGKSTTARIVAQNLNYLYVDTGAMYRALTLAILYKNVDFKDRVAVCRMAEQVNIELKPGENGPRTFLDKKDVSDEIRLPRVTEVISIIAAYKEIRDIMKKKQRTLARKGGVVMDGRDIGTVVLPHADLKIYMDASLDERAARRQQELTAKGLQVRFNKIKEELTERDQLDSNRDVAPLKPADDAIIIDTSNLTITQQVQKIMDIIRTLKLS